MIYQFWIIPDFPVGKINVAAYQMKQNGPVANIVEVEMPWIPRDHKYNTFLHVCNQHLTEHREIERIEICQ